MGSFQIKSNLLLTLRDRGKIVARREGHNIWLDVGRTYLARLLAYSSFIPLTPQQDNRISYIGFGVGGNRQGALAVANNDPILSHYPGTNAVTDIEPGTLALERPVRFGWVGPTPLAPTGSIPSLIYDPGDIWLKQIQIPSHPTTTSTRCSIVATTTDINGGYYLSVPLSEVGLFHRGSSTYVYNNSPVAYDTFDTLPKTAAFDLNISWTIRF